MPKFSILAVIFAAFFPCLSGCDGSAPGANDGSVAVLDPGKPDWSLPWDGGGASTGSDAGLGDGGDVDVCSMTSARTSPLIVFSHPEVSEEPFLDAIARAKRSIRVMVYEFTSPTIREALRARAGEVDVRVILDQGKKGHNQKTFDVLTAAGAQVIWSDPVFKYMHAKVVLIDEEEAIISTGNLDTFMDSGRNLGAIDRDEDDVAALTDLFDADFTRTSPDLDCTRLLVSPVNARERHLELIRSARTSLVIESMQFGDHEIRDAVLDRAKAGVSVRVLLAAPSWVTANKYAGEWLRENGIDGRWRSSPAVHVKAFVVDGVTAFLGSENLSWTSLSSNREVGLVTTEVDDVALIAGTFETDFATATPF